MQLTTAQRKGLLKIGDVMIPGDGTLPSFSAAGVVDELESVLPLMNESDRVAILALFATCAKLPTPAVRRIVALAAGWRRAPEPAAGVLRMLNIGLKGIVHALYYADVHHQGIHQRIGYDATINETENQGRP